MSQFTFSALEHLYFVQGEETNRIAHLDQTGVRHELNIDVDIVDINRVSLHPNGKKLVFDGIPRDVYKAGKRRWNVYVHDCESGKTTQLTEDQNCVTPGWTLDGEHILYIQARAVEDTPIYRMKPDGSEQEEFLPLDRRDLRTLLYPTQSADDGVTYIMGMLHSRGNTPRFLLYVAREAGLLPMGKPGTSSNFGLSPDGTRMARVREGRLQMMHLSDYQSEYVTLGDAELEESGFTAVWSRDGHYIAASYDGTVYVIELASRRIIHAIKDVSYQSALAW